MSDTSLPPDIGQQGQTHITTTSQNAPAQNAEQVIIADAKLIEIPEDLRNLPQKIQINVSKIPQEIEIDLDAQAALQRLTLIRDTGNIQIQLPRDIDLTQLKTITLPPEIQVNKAVEVHLYLTDIAVAEIKVALKPDTAQATSAAQPVTEQEVVGKLIPAYILPPITEAHARPTPDFDLPPLIIDDPDILQQVHHKIDTQAGIILQNETALDTAKTLSQFMSDTQKSLPIDQTLMIKPEPQVTLTQSPAQDKAPEAPQKQVFEIIAHQQKNASSAQIPAQVQQNDAKLPPPVIAEVTKFTPQNFPILTLPDQNQVILQQSLPLNIGDQVTLQPQPQLQAQLSEATDQIRPSAPYQQNPLAPAYYTSPAFMNEIRDFIPGYSQHWDALDQAIKTLQETAPQAAQAVQNTVPQPSARIVPTALFFLMAMKMGRVENWLGDKNITALQNAGKADIVEKLSSDFTKIINRAQEGVTGDWKHISMPMLYDEQLGAFQLYLHDPGEDASDNPDISKQKRFIIDFQFSQLGALQLDGLLANKNLELMVKSERPLSTDMRQEIRQKFKAGIDEAQLTGELTFKAGKDHFFTLPTPEGETDSLWV